MARFILLFAVISCSHPRAAESPVIGSKACKTAEGKGPKAGEDNKTASADPLQLDGAPEISAQVAASLDRYTNGRSASASSLDASGQRMLIITRFADTSQGHLVAKPLGARKQVTFLSEPVRGIGFVPNTQDWVTYVSDKGGTEKHQIYKMNIETSKTVLLTDGKSRNTGPGWSHKGDKFVFASNRRNGKDFDIWMSDGKSAESAKLLVKAQGWWYPLHWSLDDAKLLVGQYISINESRVYLVDIATGKVKQITPDGKVAYSSAKFSADKNRLYVVSDRGGEFAELYEYNLKSEKWRSLTSKIPWDVLGMSLSLDGRELAFTTNENGYNRVYVLNSRTRAYKKLPLPDGLISGVSFARKAKILKMSISGPTNNGDAYTYDLKRKKLVRWTDSELGGIDETKLVAPKMIEYESFDGKKIPAIYYRPQGTGPFPVIVNIHGGPESQARPFFSSFTQYMVGERNVAVIYPNVRGSSGYGKTYVQLDNGFKREDSVKDIGALLDWIDKQPELDGKKIGVTGGSYGGYMVLASLVHYGDRIVAGAEAVGISNFVTFLTNTADYRRDLRRAEYGDERDAAMKAHLQKISPLNHVDKISSALFVAQGANDPRVPASEAEQIVKAVRSNGKDVWYMLAMNEGHGFAKKTNRDVYLQLLTMFFERHLLGIEHK